MYEELMNRVQQKMACRISVHIASMDHRTKWLELRLFLLLPPSDGEGVFWDKFISAGSPEF